MKYTLLQQEDFKRTEQSFKNFPTGQKFLANYAHAIYPSLYGNSLFYYEQSSQPDVKCELSLGSKIFGFIRQSLTYKRTTKGETTRISIPKKIGDRKVELDTKTNKLVITLKAETTELSVCDVFDRNAIDDNKLLSSKHTTKQINLAILASIANDGSATTKKNL